MKALTLPVLLITLAMLAACGGGENGGGPEGGGGNAEDFGDGVLGNPCALVSPSEIGDIMGSEVGSGQLSDDGHTCGFFVTETPAPGEFEFVTVSLVLSGAFSSTVSLGAEEFDGPGDRTAWWQPRNDYSDPVDFLDAVQGKEMVSIGISPGGLADGREKAIKIAEKALDDSASQDQIPTLQSTQPPTQAVTPAPTATYRTSAIPSKTATKAASMTARPTVVTGINPCELITSADASQALGSAVDEVEPEEMGSPGYTRCDYSPAGQSSLYVSLEVWADPAAADETATAFIEARESSQLQKVPGLGDVSIWLVSGPTTGILKVVGKSTVLIIVVQGPAGTDNQQQSIALARTALERLPE